MTAVLKWHFSVSSPWHRATGILEKLEGMNSPVLKDSLTFEANALRKLGDGRMKCRS